MTTPVRPIFQKQGPDANCVIAGKLLGWKSCTAYAMAMGIDVATRGKLRPSGCKVRSLTGDTDAGLMLGQVAAVAQEHFGVPVAVRTGPNAISSSAAAQRVRAGQGFVLQGNTGALPGGLRAGGSNAANHAVWVNEVRGGTADAPAEALVYDPAADGRRSGITVAPDWWAWHDVLGFASALVLDPHGRKLGTGRMYAGFVPASAANVSPQPPPAPAPATQPTFRFGGKPTTPLPDHVRANPPRGRRVNVRRRPDRLAPGDIVELLSSGALFIAFQRTSTGAKPAGSNSRTWYGNRDGTQWIHVSGLRSLGAAAAGAAASPMPSPEPPTDTDPDPDPDDIPDGADDLPDDVRDDDLSEGEPADDPAPGDTDTDAPVIGTTFDRDIDEETPGQSG